MEEWDWEKNGELGLNPEEITGGSKVKPNWICKKCGHKWRASVYNRTRGSGCPCCVKYIHTSYSEQAIYYYVKQVFPDAINGYTDLGFELDIYIPSIKTAIEYDGYIAHNDRWEKDNAKNLKCKQHKIQLIRVREKRLGDFNFNNCVCIARSTTSSSSLNSAINELLKYLNSPKINVDVSKDHVKIGEMYKSFAYENSFAKIYPNIAKEWHPTKNGNLTPDKFSKGSGFYVWWKCLNCDHEWMSPPKERAKGYGCPECAKEKRKQSYQKTIAQRMLNIRENSLAEHFPKIASEWHPTKNGTLTPYMFPKRSNKKVWWLCPDCGHEWRAVIADRTGAKRTGCPECAKKKREQSRQKTIAIKKSNSLKTA